MVKNNVKRASEEYILVYCGRGENHLQGELVGKSYLGGGGIWFLDRYIGPCASR